MDVVGALLTYTEALYTRTVNKCYTGVQRLRDWYSSLQSPFDRFPVPTTFLFCILFPGLVLTLLFNDIYRSRAGAYGLPKKAMVTWTLDTTAPYYTMHGYSHPFSNLPGTSMEKLEIGVVDDFRINARMSPSE